MLPGIQRFFESEDGKREFAEWQNEKRASQQEGGEVR
jgi:hypothetical protein